MRLKVQRRHVLVNAKTKRGCPARRKEWDAGYLKCGCPVWILGTHPKLGYIRKSAKPYLPFELETSIDAGHRLAEQWERDGAITYLREGPPEPPQPGEEGDKDPGDGRDTLEGITIAEAVRTFFRDKAAVLEPNTMQIYRISLGPDLPRKSKVRRAPSLLTFCSERKITYLGMYTRDTARDLRDALTALKPSSRRLRHINLDTFFNWCVREKLIRESPMATLDLPPNGDATTGVFEPDEYQRVLDACDRFDLTGNRNTIRTGRRLRAFTELLRWSGLRVSDVVRLERKALTWDKTSETWGINLRQKKTKNHVACAIPPHVAELVQSAAPVPGSKDYNPAYFFWDGKSDPDTVASLWGNAFSTVCGRADLREADGSKKRCHPHMLRDTFAVEALIAKVGIHVVSKRLGHKSITTTEQAYMPFVARRAASDTQQIKDSWATQGLPSTPPKPALKIVPKKKASGG